MDALKELEQMSGDGCFILLSFDAWALRAAGAAFWMWAAPAVRPLAQTRVGSSTWLGK